MICWRQLRPSTSQTARRRCGRRTTAFGQRSTAPLIAQMEADDRRPNPRAFALMVAALRANGWDGCCSDARPFGATGRMRAPAS